MFDRNRPPEPLTRRVRRLERICVALLLSVLLLGFSTIRLAWTMNSTLYTFEIIVDRLELLTEQVDAAREKIDGICQCS